MFQWEAEFLEQDGTETTGLQEESLSAALPPSGRTILSAVLH